MNQWHVDHKICTSYVSEKLYAADLSFNQAKLTLKILAILSSMLQMAKMRRQYVKLNELIYVYFGTPEEEK
jgi:hypothetical protein